MTKKPANYRSHDHATAKVTPRTDGSYRRTLTDAYHIGTVIRQDAIGLINIVDTYGVHSREFYDVTILVSAYGMHTELAKRLYEDLLQPAFRGKTHIKEVPEYKQELFIDLLRKIAKKNGKEMTRKNVRESLEMMISRGRN